MPIPQQQTYYRLYAAEISYYSGKVRPAFRYKRIPHVEILPTTKVQREVVKPRTGLAMIPTVITPEDETWQDSSDILDALEALYPDPPLYPTTPVQRLFGYLVELWVDEFLILPGVHYRWSYPDGAARGRQDFTVMTGSEEVLQFADQVVMFTQMVGVRPETIPHIEAHLRETLAILEAQFADEPYFLGGRPSLADCAFMGPMYAHWYLDLVPGKLVRETAFRTCHWVERMNHPDPDGFGPWRADDGLSAPMRELLHLIGRDAVPFVLDVARAFDAWADTAPRDGKYLPRVVGMHASRLRGVEFERITTPYTQWMVQRVQGAYATLDAAGRRAVDAALAGTGCEALLAHAVRHRVARKPFRLVLADGPA